jgi:hypothetical protein
MNQLEIGNAIEKGVGAIAAERAHIAMVKSELVRKGGELFFLRLNSALPIDHKPGAVAEAKGHGEALLGQYLTLVERTCLKSGEGVFERSLNKAPQAILDGFDGFIDHTPAGAKLREVERKYINHVAGQVEGLPTDERSALAMVMAEQHQASQKAEAKIMDELASDLAELETRYPAKKKR